jgi:hypothetical protein
VFRKCGGSTDIKLHEPLTEREDDEEDVGGETVGGLPMLSPRTAFLAGSDGFPNVIVVFFLLTDGSFGDPGVDRCPELISRTFEGVLAVVLERSLLFRGPPSPPDSIILR